MTAPQLKLRWPHLAERDRKRGRGEGMKVGDKVEAFTLDDQDGNSVSLESLLTGPLVMYFYIKAMTPG